MSLSQPCFEYSYNNYIESNEYEISKDFTNNMSYSLSPDWESRLESFYDKDIYESNRTILFEIINQFDCDEIYNPNINEHEIFV